MLWKALSTKWKSKTSQNWPSMTWHFTNGFWFSWKNSPTLIAQLWFCLFFFLLTKWGDFRCFMDCRPDLGKNLQTRGWQTAACRPNLSHSPVFANKALSKQPCLFIYICLWLLLTIRTEASSFAESHTTHKAQIIYSGSLRKMFAYSCFHHENWKPKSLQGCYVRSWPKMPRQPSTWGEGCVLCEFWSLSLLLVTVGKPLPPLILHFPTGKEKGINQVIPMLYTLTLSHCVGSLSVILYLSEAPWPLQVSVVVSKGLHYSSEPREKGSHENYEGNQGPGRLNYFPRMVPLVWNLALEMKTMCIQQQSVWMKNENQRHGLVQSTPTTEEFSDKHQSWAREAHR